MKIFHFPFKLSFNDKSKSRIYLFLLELGIGLLTLLIVYDAITIVLQVFASKLEMKKLNQKLKLFVLACKILCHIFIMAFAQQHLLLCGTVNLNLEFIR